MAGKEDGEGMVERYMAATGEERIKMWLDTHNGPGVAGVPNPKVRTLLLLLPPSLPLPLPTLPKAKASGAR